MNPLKKAVVKVVVKRGAKEIHQRIDTPEERRRIVEKVKIEGLSPVASWSIAILVSLALDALSTTGFDLLIAGDTHSWLMLFLRTFAAKAMLMIDENKEADVQEEEDKDKEKE